MRRIAMIGAIGLSTVAIAGCGSASQNSTQATTQAAAPTTNFISQAALQSEMTSQERANIAKNSTLAGSVKITPFVCTGPIGATSTSEQWSCQTVESTVAVAGNTLRQTASVAVTAYPDGSWISGAG